MYTYWNLLTLKVLTNPLSSPIWIKTETLSDNEFHLLVWSLSSANSSQVVLAILLHYVDCMLVYKNNNGMLIDLICKHTHVVYISWHREQSVDYFYTSTFWIIKSIRVSVAALEPFNTFQWRYSIYISMAWFTVWRFFKIQLTLFSITKVGIILSPLYRQFFYKSTALDCPYIRRASN